MILVEELLIWEWKASQNSRFAPSTILWSLVIKHFEISQSIWKNWAKPSTMGSLQGTSIMSYTKVFLCCQIIHFLFQFIGSNFLLILGKNMFNLRHIFNRFLPINKLISIQDHLTFVSFISYCTISTITFTKWIQMIIAAPIDMLQQDVQHFVVVCWTIMQLTVVTNLHYVLSCFLFLFKMVFNYLENNVSLFQTTNLLPSI